jgi:hypothetical protein
MNLLSPFFWKIGAVLLLCLLSVFQCKPLKKPIEAVKHRPHSELLFVGFCQRKTSTVDFDDSTFFCLLATATSPSFV